MFNLKNIDIRYVFLIFVLLLVYLWPIVTNPTETIFPGGDFLEARSFWNYHLKSSFSEFGELPLWNQYTRLGQPFLANMQTSILYPPHILYFIMDGSLVHNIMLFLHMFLLGFFTYILLRYYKLDRISSIFSSIVATFSGFVVTNVIYAGHTWGLESIFVMPLAILLIEKIFSEKSYSHTIFLGIVMSLGFLAGHVEYYFFMVVGLVIFSLIRLIQILKTSSDGSKSIIKYACLFFVAFIVMFGLIQMQFLPSFEFLQESVRSEGFDSSNMLFFMSPKHLVNFVMPEFFGTPLDGSYWGDRNFFHLGCYVGIITLFFTSLMIFDKNKITRAAILASLVSLIIYMGPNTPLVNIFIHIPGFSLFKTFAPICFSLILFISIVSGFGFSKFINKIKNKDYVFYNILKILSVILLIILIIFSVFRGTIMDYGETILENKYSSAVDQGFDMENIDYYNSKIGIVFENMVFGILTLFIIILLFLGAYFVHIKGMINVKTFSYMILFILVIDLFLFGMSYVDVRSSDEMFSMYDSEMESVFVSSNEFDEKFRIVDFFYWIIPQQISIRYDIEKLDGYDVFKTTKSDNYQQYIMNCYDVGDYDCVSSLASLSNTKYLISEKVIGFSGFDLIYVSNKTIRNIPRYYNTPRNFETNKTYIYENFNVMPRAYVTENVLETNIIGDLIDYDPGYVSADIGFYSPNKVIVDATGPGVLVLSDSWYPGWVASVNGVVVNVEEVNYMFRGVEIGEGENEIVFSYEPKTFYYGLIITLFTIIIVLIVLYKKYIKHE